MRVCLDENQIGEFLAGALPPMEFRRCEDHLDRCEMCRVVVAELAHSSAVGDRTLEDDSGVLPTLPGKAGAGIGDAWGSGGLLAERFRLLRIAGQGGMGVVYEAEDTVLGLRVALKMLPADFTNSPAYLRHLHSEIRIGRRIAHRNVCRIYDLGTSADLHFITMEYVAGETLATLLARGHLARPRAVEILNQVVNALDAAHEAGIIHRDLKPTNIMIDGASQVKVMDFGLAKDLAEKSSVHRGPIGTPAYWAPEQARGDSAGPQTDIFSFGLVAYEILTGCYPGERERRTLPGLTSRERALIKRCLDVDPAQRYASARDLRIAMRALQHRPRRYQQAMMAAIVGTTMLAGGAFVVSDFGKTARAGGTSRSPAASAEIARPVFEHRVASPVAATGPIATPLMDAAVPASPKREEPQAHVEGKRSDGKRSRQRIRAATAIAPAIERPSLHPSEPTESAEPTKGATEPGNAVEATVDSAETEASASSSRVDATFVRRKLERIKRLADNDSVSAETSAEIRQLFAQVHRAYFDADYTAANKHLTAIANLVSKERRP